MATTSRAFYGPSSRNRNRFKGLWIAALCVAGSVLIGGLAAGYWFYSAATAALPQLDGSVQAAGLSTPVSVLRDAQGMPHISAANVDDLLFAQGYVTAQDRLWQMDLNRRFGGGELAEIFGSGVLKVDQRHRMLRIRETAERLVATLSAGDREHLNAYVKGVNALIDHQREHLPIEFRILRYTPAPWTAVDSVIVGINISESLSTSFPTEHAREQISAKLTPDQAADLYPLTSWRDRPPSAVARDQQYTPTQYPPTPDNKEEGTSQKMFGETRDLCDDCFAGSNNWVVSGSHTTTGKPLLSNDMHLNHSIPNVWYEVHLNSGDYDAGAVARS